jgi:hypothetical protein
MAGQSWHAFFYEETGLKSAPFRSTWIEAEKEEDAVRIAKASLKRGQRAELVRPRWEGGFAPIMVSGEAWDRQADRRHV